MSQRYRHRRTFSPGTAFPSPIEPGEIAVNTANRQIAVGDAAAGVLGVPLPLLGVRIFDARASYATNDYVVQGGSFYRAKSAINPGAFNPAQWDVMSTDAAVKAYADAGDAAVSAAFAAADTTITTNYQAADTALTTSINGKVAKAGDTMTGPLVLPVAAPTLDPQAANKKYVDDKVASIPTPSSLTVSDTPPTGVPDGALWWESDSGLLYVRYNDGNTTQWVIAAPQPDINAFALANTVVRYDTAQSLTPPQQQQARQNIYAAPFDAMAYGGLQINGSFDVGQELGNATITAAGAICDGWRTFFQGTMGITSGRTNFGGTNPFGFPNFINMVVTTAQASLAAGDLAILYQSIEGYRIARLTFGGASASAITLGFWTAHHRTGLYCGSIQNAGNNRSYVFTYTQNASDIWEYKTVTIPGDTTGTWAIDNTVGIVVGFSLAAGSTFVGPSAGVWAAGNYKAIAGQVNSVGATSDVFRVTGVILVPGNDVPNAFRSAFIMRPFDQELVLCQRYWQQYAKYRTDGYGTAGSFAVSSLSYYLMRATPTVSFSGTSTANCGAPSTVLVNANNVSIVSNVTATGGYSLTTSVTLDARL